VVACDIVAWGDLCGFFAEVGGGIDISVVAVNDIASDYNYIGRLILYLADKSGVIFSEFCIVKVGNLYDAEIVCRFGNFCRGESVFVYGKIFILEYRISSAGR
jgi:hypothetical protein